MKTLLFGAGAGARKFIVNESNNRHFLAIIDNNTEKHGGIFENLPIISPTQIDHFYYDEIVITTQWAHEVQQQLIHELNIDPAKIVIPVKSMLKTPSPFLHLPTRELGRNIIKVLSSSAIAHNIPLLLDFGTLLGIIRDNDIIAWDDDIDFAIPIELSSSDIGIWLLATLKSSGLSIEWHIEKLFDQDNRLISLLIKFNPLSIKTQDEYVPFTTSISFREIQGEHSIHLPSLGLWYSPSVHFQTIQTHLWNGFPLQIPFQHEAYLSFVYGDWKIPKKDMKLTDYNHLGEVTYSHVESANLKHTLSEDVS